MIKDNIGKNTEFGIDSRYQSKVQRNADGQALMEDRLARIKNLKPQEVIRAKLLQLKLKIDEYLLNPVYVERNYFTEFLSSYIDILYEKRIKFAEDIDISPVKLSQVINNHREPQEELILRLMIHSERVYKKVCKFHERTWFQIYYHEKLSETMSSQDKWRPNVEKHVKTSNLIHAR